MGTSLFFDTLRHMGYNVTASLRPMTAATNTDHVHIIIQPVHFYEEDAAAILDWVYNGGRLVFLHNNSINHITIQLTGRQTDNPTPTLHRHGQGYVITGRASNFSNNNLMLDHTAGTNLHRIISGWDFTGIIFIEYYHHTRANENFWTQLPLIVRVIFIQLVLVAIMAVWHLGKRFGNPVQYYQETERDENEHVYALAKLYWKAKTHYQRRINNDD